MCLKTRNEQRNKNEVFLVISLFLLFIELENRVLSTKTLLLCKELLFNMPLNRTYPFLYELILELRYFRFVCVGLMLQGIGRADFRRNSRPQ